MADSIGLNLNAFKSTGVYTVEVNADLNIALPLTTGRLFIGSSKKGPFNTVVLINDLKTLRAVYGEIDTKLENAGSYFHRSIEIGLREGPVYALNIMPVDTSDTNNADSVSFTTFNTEASSNNSENLPITHPIHEFFNKQQLWFASTDQLNKTKNITLGDDYLINPAGYGLSSIEANKILSFVNLGANAVTTWIRKSKVRGFEVTAKEWYSNLGTDTKIPNYVNEDDFISDYFVDIIVVDGNWSDYIKLSTDPIYKQYFDSVGLIDSKIDNFLALREIKTLARITGSLISDFKDQSGTVISIDKVFNRLFPVTGLLCALDSNKLELVDLELTQFNDVEVSSHRLDLVGYGFDELNYSIDDGDDNTDPTKLISTLSYKKPADSVLNYKISINATESGQFYTPTLGIIDADDILYVNATYDYIVAMENSKLYKAWEDGFIKTGDTASDALDASLVYLKVESNFTTVLGSQTVKFIKIYAFSDISLLIRDNATTYSVNTDDIFKITLNKGTSFKHIFDLTDPAFFTDYTVVSSNSFKLGINTSNVQNKAIIDEFIKVNHYIKANVIGSSRPRLLKIIAVTSNTTLSPARLEYVITTMTPSSVEVNGIDYSNNEISIYKGISNFASSLKGQYLTGFKVRAELLPNNTALRQKTILKYIFESSNIYKALTNPEILDYRYIVDTYAGDISASSKYYILKLAASHGKVMAFVNDPSFTQFEKSVSPSFIDQINKLVSSELIAAGGDLNLNPEELFKFAEEDINGIPLSSYGQYCLPNLLINDGGKSKLMIPAPYVSNLYIKKYKNGQPFIIVAGKNGVINDPEVIGLEYELSNEDRDFLEPLGHNLIVKRRGYGILLFSNNTAYQRLNSALNNAHVRDTLITIEKDIERILFNYLFDYNEELTRLRVKTMLENYLDAVVSVGGLSAYTIQLDANNNTNTVISANTAIVDIKVDFPRGIHKFINRLTITKVGGTSSSSSSGFIPSF